MVGLLDLYLNPVNSALPPNTWIWYSVKMSVWFFTILVLVHLNNIEIEVARLD